MQERIFAMPRITTTADLEWHEVQALQQFWAKMLHDLTITNTGGWSAADCLERLHVCENLFADLKAKYDALPKTE